MIVAWIFVLSVVCSVSADYVDDCVDDAKKEMESQEHQGIDCNESLRVALYQAMIAGTYRSSDVQLVLYCCDESLYVINCVKRYLENYLPKIPSNDIYGMIQNLKYGYAGCWPSPEVVIENCVDDAKKEMESQGHQGTDCDEPLYLINCLKGNLKRYPGIAEEIKEETESTPDCWPYPQVINENCIDDAMKEMESQGHQGTDCDESLYLINCLKGYLEKYPGIADAIEEEKNAMAECWP